MLMAIKSNRLKRVWIHLVSVSRIIHRDRYGTLRISNS
jgi:hypothetical protein